VIDKDSNWLVVGDQDFFSTFGRHSSAALRHGLSLPVLSDPTLSQEVAALARQIAGVDARPEIQELARRIAEAQVDLRRVRSLRHDLIARALSDPDYDFRTNWDKKVMTALRIVRRCCRGEDVPQEEVKFLQGIDLRRASRNQLND
jgi:hypothetical protein